jgi:hypothetical protein
VSGTELALGAAPVRPWQVGSDLTLDEPIIILTCARSGSTLLRLILDTHPELACPPETNIAKIVPLLRDIWLTVNGDSADDTLSPQGHRSISQVMEAIYEPYLRQRGKRRWCDKSIGTSEVADQFLKFYPKAKFICLYRHAMDVIGSSIEAAPWGLNGYGFDPFTITRGNNAVSAAAAYWIEHTARIMDFEERHPEACTRVYYEQLVTDPERVADEVFAFAGVAAAPGMAVLALTQQHRTGPGDHKIRVLNEITSESVGRGIRVPAGLLPAAQLLAMNQVLETLSYAQVDRAWRLSACPPSLLTCAPADPSAQCEGIGGHADVADDPATDARANSFARLSKLITHRVSENLRSSNGDAQSAPFRTFAIVAYSVAEPRVAMSWRIDLQLGTVQESSDIELEALGADWLASAELRSWHRILLEPLHTPSHIRNGIFRVVGPEMVDGPREPSRAWNSLMDSRTQWLSTVLKQCRDNDQAGMYFMLPEE